MALTTRCPHCNTAFRVAADQLKLREGQVRCGRCNAVFDGNAGLLPPISISTPPPAPTVPAAHQPAIATTPAKPNAVALNKFPHDVWRETSLDAALDYQPAVKPPLHYFDLNLDLEPAPATVAETEPDDADSAPEPAFVQQSRRRARNAQRRAWLLGLGSLILCVALLAQGWFSFRNQLAAQVPALAPAMRALCATLHCRLDLPSQIEQLTIEPGELQSVTGNTYSYATVLHNQSGAGQTWPALELTLNDSLDQPVLRRVFTPLEYVAAPTAPESGMPAHSELAIKLYFELTAIKAAGYHIAIFYP